MCFDRPITIPNVYCSGHGGRHTLLQTECHTSPQEAQRKMRRSSVQRGRAQRSCVPCIGVYISSESLVLMYTLQRPLCHRSHRTMYVKPRVPPSAPPDPHQARSAASSKSIVMLDNLTGRFGVGDATPTVVGNGNPPGELGCTEVLRGWTAGSVRVLVATGPL